MVSQTPVYPFAMYNGSHWGNVPQQPVFPPHGPPTHILPPHGPPTLPPASAFAQAIDYFRAVLVNKLYLIDPTTEGAAELLLDRSTQLLRITGQNLEFAQELFNIFEAATSMSPRAAVKEFIVNFKPTVDAPGDARLRLLFKGWISKSISLDELLNGYITNAKTPSGQAVGSTSQSSITNNIYDLNDPLRIHVFAGLQADRWYNKLHTLVRRFDRRPRTSSFPRCETQIPSVLTNEGDVTTFTTANLIMPTLVGVNAILEAAGFGIRVYARSQYTAPGVPCFLDHMFVARMPNAVDHSGDQPLVGFELKNFGSMNDWIECLETQRGHSMRDRDDRYYPLNNSEWTHFVRLKRMIPQLRKYVFRFELAYIMSSDGNQHIGQIWSRPAHWPSGRGAGVADTYMRREYTSGQRQRCQIIPSVNVNRVGETKPTGKETLALLIFMALSDWGYNVHLSSAP